VEGVPAGFEADSLLNAEQRALLDPAVLETVRDVLASALHDVYFIILICAAIAFGVFLFFPRGKAHELAAGAQPQPQTDTQQAQRGEVPAGEPEPSPGGSG
jgi:hypothetical protein